MKSFGGSISSVRVGTWIAGVLYVSSKQSGALCGELHACHESLPTTEGLRWRRQSGHIGVDCGQAGIFDAKHFNKEEAVPEKYRWKDDLIDPERRWYSLCCDVTLGVAQAGIVPFGVTSNSGLGDGAYRWDVLRDGKDVVAVRIIFIPQGRR